MVNVAVGTGFGFSFQQVGQDIAQLVNGTPVLESKTELKVQTSDLSIDVSGFHFAYSHGIPTGGTVTSVEVDVGGHMALKLQGLSLSVADVVHVASTPSTADDIALVKSVLGGNDLLSGGDHADLFFGLGGNDRIGGNGGNDRISGGAGNDVLSGKADSDILSGNSGNDILNGGAGADKLSGGTGDDTFVFNVNVATNGFDTITDFTSHHDHIDLVRAMFRGLAAGPLTASEFHVGAHATTADQHIIYNSANGALFYDVDGNGQHAAVHFATLTGHPALTAADFIIS